MQSNSKPQNIILTGFMGTGKTTVGQVLARELGYRFVDTDHLIETRHGKTIAAIFAEEGETVFRRLEQETASDLAAQAGLLISTGGRMLLDPHNAEVLARSGQIFCLAATPETILARVIRNGHLSKRPLLAGDDPAAKIQDLLNARRAGYGQFTQIETDGLSPNEVAATIIKHLN